MNHNGYHGKILHADLIARRAWIEEPDERFWRIYCGGGLLAAYYLLRECPRGAVMGSKRVKAIVIRGDHHPPVANPAHCAELTEHYRGALRWQASRPRTIRQRSADLLSYDGLGRPRDALGTRLSSTITLSGRSKWDTLNASE